MFAIGTTEFIIAIAIAVLLAGTLAFLHWKQGRDMKKAAAAGGSSTSGKPGSPGSAAGTGTGGFATQDPGARQLQWQAYERLLLLTDRIAIPNLVQRAGQSGLSARDMQALLTQTIRQEFEHNITQQMYVSPEAWDVIRNYKEQNLLIINQIASFLPETATGADLSRHLLDLLVQNPKASLQQIVSEALSFEAKKLM